MFDLINIGCSSATPDLPSLKHSFPRALSQVVQNPFHVMSGTLPTSREGVSLCHYVAGHCGLQNQLNGHLRAGHLLYLVCSYNKRPHWVSNTLESSVNSTPHLGKLGGGTDVNKYNEGLLLSNERLDSYTRSANWIIGTTKGQSKLPGQLGSEGII